MAMGQGCALHPNVYDDGNLKRHAMEREGEANGGQQPAGEEQQPVGPDDAAAEGSIVRGGGVGRNVHVGMVASVIKGFGRGSKLLGIPTANMCMQDVGHAADQMETGIYFGFTVLQGEVYDAVVSIGWNPYFQNKAKTVEPHLLHDFAEDFYGETLSLLICGYIRPELNFSSLEALILGIKGDIEYAKLKLTEPSIRAYRSREAIVSACLATAHANNSAYSSKQR